LSLRAKGYSWTAVAAMLSERGVPVSVAALRTYLRRVREDAAEDAPRSPPKRSRDVRGNAPTAERRPPIAPLPSQPDETPPVRRPLPPVATPAPAPAAPRAPVPMTPRDPESGRAAFAVRPDTKDL